MTLPHPSIAQLTAANFATQQRPLRAIPAIQFCDNEVDCNQCLQLVLAGVKRATATAVWEFALLAEAIPKVGDLYVVTDWHGVGYCIIQTTKVTQLTFAEVTAEHALLEGEGDQSLAYWQQVHRDYYQRQFAGSRFRFDENIALIFEEFAVVYRTVDCQS